MNERNKSKIDWETYGKDKVVPANRASTSKDGEEPSPTQGVEKTGRHGTRDG